ncbi:Sec-independent protein translocase protein TatB [Aromatoleum diolicum]|uniref:Sec-independent protein translocase protein TatB n=1 Tax=Aromatoleum diolicum TaxID=75796 RepID=A0ABX1Q5X5_9RHOO|nr:Sec-independent protein translocase protein TatB [Aromatoleum diolicum]NMG73761.1 twin-arginine translocase subunit TatB [Aromatoleum diolicum]
MFDFGFSELIVIAVVMLIVVGPERLPKVARTAGHLLGRLQRYVTDVKSDIQREMQLEDLKKLQQQVEQQARELESSVRSQMNSVEADLGKTAAEVQSSVAIAANESSAAAPVAVEQATTVPLAPAGGASETAALPANPAPVDGASAEPSPQLELGLGPAPSPGQTAEKV